MLFRSESGRELSFSPGPSTRDVLSLVNGAAVGIGLTMILPCDVKSIRTAVPWSGRGPLIRLHAGLEDADDLIADLSAGFDRLNQACRQ